MSVEVTLLYYSIEYIEFDCTVRLYTIMVAAVARVTARTSAQVGCAVRDSLMDSLHDSL